MKSIISFTTTILCLVSVSICFGNTGVFYGSGNQVIPIKNDQIQLVRENVTVKLTVVENSESGRFGIPFIPWANVTATFHLKNTTTNEVTLQMGFPFLDLQGFGDEKYVLSNLNFKVVANGNDIKTEMKQGLIEKEFDPTGLFKKVFAWSASFQPSEEREFVVTYRMLMSVASANTAFRDSDEQGEKFESLDNLLVAASYNFGYITKTAYTWAGSIEEAKFQVDCTAFYNELDKQNFLQTFLACAKQDDLGFKRPVFVESVSPKPEKTDNGIYKWIFRGKVPEEGLSFNTIVLFLPSRAAELNKYYSASLSHLKNITPDEFKSILKAYYQALAFDKEPSELFPKNYFKEFPVVKMPKTFVFKSDKVGIEYIANHIDELLKK